MNRIVQMAALLIAVGLIACGGQNSDTQGKSAGPAIPKDVSGLEIKGPRTKANVLHNMAGAVHKMQEIYKEHLKRNPGLKGRIELKLTVEWNGEIMQIATGRSTLQDEAFEKALLRPLQFMDFDGWDASNEETEILYPVEFES